MGKSEKREPCSSVLQMGSTKESCDSFGDIEAAPPRGGLDFGVLDDDESLSLPPRSLRRAAGDLPQILLCCGLLRKNGWARRIMMSGRNTEYTEDIHINIQTKNK